MEDAALVKTTTQKEIKQKVEEEVKETRKRRVRKFPERKDLVVEVTDKSLYRIKYEGGGQLPSMLSGLYTNPRIAQRDIESYLEKRGK